MSKSYAYLVLCWCLVVAEINAPRTVFHDRIDGLLLPGDLP
jgi:hypothetical protein